MTHEYTTVERAPLDIDRINHLLEEAGEGLALHYSRVTSSTQADAKALLDEGAKPPFACLTDEQTLGRGRLDRTWVAPTDSSVLMTFAMGRPDELATLPLLAGVAAAHVLRDAGADVRLKWPNDIVFVGAQGLRKVGGMIAEVHGDAVLLGIGINIAMEAAELPTPEATSLSLEGVLADRERIIAALLIRLLALRPSPLSEYRHLCDTIGRDVHVQQVGGTTVIGRATGVDDDGALLIRAADTTVRVTSGDVFQVRGVAAP